MGSIKELKEKKLHISDDAIKQIAKLCENCNCKDAYNKIKSSIISHSNDFKRVNLWNKSNIECKAYNTCTLEDKKLAIKEIKKIKTANSTFKNKIDKFDKEIPNLAWLITGDAENEFYEEHIKPWDSIYKQATELDLTLESLIKSINTSFKQGAPNKLEYLKYYVCIVAEIYTDVTGNKFTYIDPEDNGKSFGHQFVEVTIKNVKLFNNEYTDKNIATACNYAYRDLLKANVRKQNS